MRGPSLRRGSCRTKTTLRETGLSLITVCQRTPEMEVMQGQVITVCHRMTDVETGDQVSMSLPGKIEKDAIPGQIITQWHGLRIKIGEH